MTHPSSTKTATLYYSHDPMCSWCWAFAPSWAQIRTQLPKNVQLRILLGGLAPDSHKPMPAQMQQFLQQTWQRISQQVPGTEFNFDFWKDCQPRRSTYPACRAVIAAGLQGNSQDETVEIEQRMTHAIQQAYYLEAKNPSDDETLITLARQLGLDGDAFANALNAESTQALLLSQIAEVAELGVQGFPNLLLERGGQRWLIPVGYNDSGQSLAAINQALSDG